MKFIIEYNTFREEVEVSRAQIVNLVSSLDGGDFFHVYDPESDILIESSIKKVEKSTGDYIVKKFKEIDKNNDYVIKLPQDSTGIKNIRIKSIFFTFGGTRAAEFDSIIQEIEDEYFMVTISFGLTRPHHFMCDQVDGLMAFLKSIYDILEKFRIGRRIDKRLKLESNQSSEWYEKLPDNDIKFFKRYNKIHFLPKEIQDLREFSERFGFGIERDFYDYSLTFRKFRFSEIKIEVVKFEDEWYRVLISGGGKFEWYRCDSLGGLKYFLNEKMSNFHKIL
jgi:hypothetical protein